LTRHYSNPLDSQAQRWLENNGNKLPKMSAGKKKLVYEHNKSFDNLSQRAPSDIYVRGQFNLYISQENPYQIVEYGPVYPHWQWQHGVL
jgi:hypothetical protein